MSSKNELFFFYTEVYQTKDINYLIPVNFLLFFLSIHKTYLLWLMNS